MLTSNLGYNKKLEEIKNLRKEILSIKYSKDQLLNKLLEICEPPVYLSHKFFNYKALVLYFIRNYNSQAIKIQKQFLDNSADKNFTEYEEKIFQSQFDHIIIKTNLDSLLHLINIDKEKIRPHRIFEQMIYGTLEYGEHTGSEGMFQSKVESIAWVKNTLTNPHFIYGKDTNTSKKLDFDFAFIRETGLGTKSQPYMYHLVGLRQEYNKHNRKNKNIYNIVSQFPIEKDKSIKIVGDENITSQLSNYVLCNKPLYKQNDKKLPLSPREQEKSKEMEKLKKYFER